MECYICHTKFELPKDKNGKELSTNVCGTCAQILIDEAEAGFEAMKYEGDEIIRQQAEFDANEERANKEAYEEAIAKEHFDTGNGWRYV